MRHTLLAVIAGLISAALLPAAARADWLEARSNHFILYSDDTPDHVRAFSARLERFDRAMRAMRGMPDDPAGPASRLTIYVVDNVASIQRLIGKEEKNVAGFYEPRAKAVAFVPRKSGSGGDFDLTAQQILLHEYTHHFMLTNWTRAAFPAWFVEGFAEFNATAIFRPDGGVTLGAQPRYRVYGLHAIDPLPLERLLRPDPGKLTDEQTEALYARGWLLTHYLTFEPSRRGQLDAYIAAINAGKPTAEAVKAFVDLGKLDAALDRYNDRSLLPAVTLKGDTLAIGDIAIRALGPGEVAVMPAVLRINRGVDKDSAPAVAALARRLATPYPNDAAAQNELAEAECDASRFIACGAAAQRAIAADRRSVHAQLYEGLALAGIATAAHTTDAKTWAGIRAYFLAANRLDTEDPEPLILFYTSFLQADQTPTRNADAGLLYAYALAPHDLALRYMAARVLLQQGDGAGARKAIAPLAYSPHGGGGDAAELLAILDNKGVAAALAKMDAAKEGPANTPHAPAGAGAGSKHHDDIMVPWMATPPAVRAASPGQVG